MGHISHLFNVFTNQLNSINSIGFKTWFLHWAANRLGHCLNDRFHTMWSAGFGPFDEYFVTLLWNSRRNTQILTVHQRPEKVSQLAQSIQSSGVALGD
jgi:hypothetical protein